MKVKFSDYAIYNNKTNCTLLYVTMTQSIKAVDITIIKEEEREWLNPQQEPVLKVAPIATCISINRML